ncbi:membrane protein insertase YidC [bacterium]|nr:membrane protein insertase YidC [bacterium]
MKTISAWLLQLLVALNGFTGNIGVTIIVFTLAFRGLLLALTWRSHQSLQKIKELDPQVRELRAKYQDDQAKLNQAQLELYQKYNVNPASGCLPQILQIIMLIIFYRALMSLLGQENLVNTGFLWFDVTTSDPLHIIPILAAAAQLFLSVMTLPGGEVRDLVPNDSQSKKVQAANQKEEDTAAMAATMQKQMLFMMPCMTGVIAWSLPAGLGLYWIVSTIFSIGQQAAISGWGGITLYFKRLINVFSKKEDKN